MTSDVQMNVLKTGRSRVDVTSARAAAGPGNQGAGSGPAGRRASGHPPPAGGTSARFGDILAGEVLDRLALLDRVAAGEARTAAEVARIRAALADAVAMWRRLLGRHRPGDDRARCPHCRGWFGRRAWWPCPVWIRAYHRLIINDDATRPR